MREYVFHLLKKYDYNWEKIYDAIKNKEFVSNEEASIFADYKNYIMMIDDNYPESLKVVETPPFVLFFKGSEKIITKNNSFPTLIHCDSDLSNYGKEMCLKTIKNCKKNNDSIIVLEWTSAGQYLMNLALKEEVSVLSVLSSGRKMNKYAYVNSSLISYVTIFLDDKKATEKTEEYSMWLAAALCYRCIIPEIDNKNDKLKIVDNCLSMGKKVFAYPTNITNKNQGTNYLIRQGATLIM